jgi:predicted nucleotide-binding protein
MKERFEGANRPALIAALQDQSSVKAKPAVAEQLADKGTLLDFAKGEDIITQGASDTDVFLLIMGVIAIIVNGAQINMRRAGDRVGEMAAIEPSLPRSATVRALEPCVALKISSADFMEICKASQEIWLPIAKELSKRLQQRNLTILVPNKEPKLFIISSSEAKPIAHAIRDDLEKDIFIKVWDQDVFFAGGYPLEALEAQLTQADFAVAVGAADDLTKSRGKKANTVRDNVVFELGLFMGKLTRYRAVLVHPRVADLKLPSDLHGLTAIPYDDGDPSTAGARVVPVCKTLRGLIKKAAVRTFTFETDRGV